MRRRAGLLIVLTMTGTSGCGGDDDTERPARQAQQAAAQAHPPAPAAAAALSRVPLVPQAEHRLAYVNLARRRQMNRFGGHWLIERVLGRAMPSDGRTAVRVGDALVIRPRSSPTPTVVNAGDRLAGTLSNTATRTNVIQPETPSAVQSCLGDATAETIIGPRVLGIRSAIGAGLRPDGRGGMLVAICAAPHYAADLHRAERAIRKRYPRARGGEYEIGERETVAMTIDTAHLTGAEVAELVAGGTALRSLARGWRRRR